MAPGMGGYSAPSTQVVPTAFFAAVAWLMALCSWVLAAAVAGSITPAAAVIAAASLAAEAVCAPLTPVLVLVTTT
ncbi:MAG: hypothetical protein LBQ55_01960 [Treponema sp.]|nr:hypothetical protein [Treponema sp.]